MRTRTLLITLALAMLPLTASAQKAETKGPDLETTIQWIENMIEKNGKALVSDVLHVKNKEEIGYFGCKFSTEGNLTRKTTISGTMLTSFFKQDIRVPVGPSSSIPVIGIVEQRLDLRDLTSVTQKNGRKVCLETNEKGIEAVVVKHPIVDRGMGEGPKGAFVNDYPSWKNNGERSLKPEGTTEYTNSMCFWLEQEEHAKKLVKAFEHVKTLLQSGSKGTVYDKDLF